jgi:hypothetical protein
LSNPKLSSVQQAGDSITTRSRVSGLRGDIG